jgi:hypothetical protein
MVGGPALVLWLALAPEVRGDLDCGSAAAFETSLADLLPDQGRELNSDEVVELSREEGAVVVRLRRGDGEIVGVRRLTAASCTELARAVAVVVAAWHARVGEIPILPGPVGGVSSPASAPALSRLAAPTSTVVSWALTVGALASLDRTSLAPAARIGFARLARSGFTLGLAAYVTGSHALTIAGGTGSWSRLALGAAAGRRIGFGHGYFVDTSAAIAGSLLRVQGSGFAENDGATVFHPGAGISMRIGRAVGATAPWLGADVFVWPRQQGLFVTGASQRLNVSQLEALGGVGIDFGL